jgi:hypothetical protein
VSLRQRRSLARSKHIHHRIMIAITNYLSSGLTYRSLYSQRSDNIRTMSVSPLLAAMASL